MTTLNGAMPGPADYRELSSDLTADGRLAAMWTFEASSDGRHRVLPDGCMDLIAAFRVGEEDAVESLRLIVTGPAEGFEHVPLRQGDRFLGLRFRAGWGGSCLGVAARTLRNRESDPSTLSTSLAEAVKPLRLSRTVGALQTALANFGASAAARARPLPAAVVKAIDALHTSAGRLALPELAGLTSTPERTLRRAAGDAVGLPLKSLAAVLRFQKTLHLLEVPCPPPLAAIALEGGYSDQAHMTRDFRRLGGFTPGRPPPLTLVGIPLEPVAEICKSAKPQPGRCG